MTSTIAAITTGGGGVVTTADASGELSLLSGATTILAATATGVAVTGTLSASGITTVAAGSAALPAIISTTGTADTGLWFPAADTVAASTAGAERMRIDTSGSVLIAETTTSPYFDGNLNVTKAGNIAFCAKVTGNVNAAAIAVTNTATSGDNAFITFQTETSPSVRGAITYNRSAGLTSYNTTSDQRLKDNIVDASSALSKIDSVKIRSFDWKETGNHVDFGVIAQELITVAPECVTKGQDNDDGSIKNAWSVDTSALVPALVKAIQELKAIVDTQATRIAALERV